MGIGDQLRSQHQFATTSFTKPAWWSHTSHWNVLFIVFGPQPTEIKIVHFKILFQKVGLPLGKFIHVIQHNKQVEKCIIISIEVEESFHGIQYLFMT